MAFATIEKDEDKKNHPQTLLQSASDATKGSDGLSERSKEEFKKKVLLHIHHNKLRLGSKFIRFDLPKKAFEEQRSQGKIGVKEISCYLEQLKSLKEILTEREVLSLKLFKKTMESPALEMFEKVDLIISLSEKSLTSLIHDFQEEYDRVNALFYKEKKE